VSSIEPFAGEPHKDRFLAALRGEHTDRVPHFEILIEDQHVRKLLGRPARPSEPSTRRDFNRRAGRGRKGVGGIGRQRGRFGLWQPKRGELAPSARAGSSEC